LEIYGLLLAGRSDGGRSPPGFRDYVAWLDKQDAAAAEAFWQERLAGFHSPTPIGSARAETTDSPQAYRSGVAHLPAEAATALNGWLRERQLTLSTLIHASWALLLARHSGQHGVVFGTTVSGRPAELPGIETMIGPFINNVPLRVKLPGDQTVL